MDEEEEGSSALEREQEISLRLQALQLAIPSPVNGERKEEVVARANAYLTFLKGNN